MKIINLISRIFLVSTLNILTIIPAPKINHISWSKIIVEHDDGTQQEYIDCK